MSTVVEQISKVEAKSRLLALSADQDDQSEDLFTIHDLEKLPENDWFRIELIGGEMIVSTAPRYLHQLIVSRLIGEISAYLKQNPIGDVVAGPGLILDVYDSVIPDAIFISHERRDRILAAQDNKLHGASELAIEVLSPGKVNARRDRVQKLEVYQQFGVEEYWIINPGAGEIEIYRRGKKGLKLHQTLKETEILTTPLLPNFSLEIKNLFA